MKDREVLLRQALSTPERSLSPDFTARIIADLTASPTKRQKEKKFSLSMAVAIIATISLIGGGVYAVINYPSLFSLLDRPSTGPVQPSDMQNIYLQYVNERRSGNQQARTNFDRHITAELAKKLDTTAGRDPIICAQNIPTSVSFEHVDAAGTMTAVNYFDTETVAVQLTYDASSGTFLDIVCPVSEQASTTEKLQGYYRQYVTDVVNSPVDARAHFYRHTNPALQSKLEQAVGYDPIICAQNTPAMVTFTDITNNSMVAVVSFMGGTQRVGLQFDPTTSVFTGVTCLDNA